MLISLLLALMIVFTARARAQEPVGSNVAAEANQWFGHLPDGLPLHCSVKIVRPFLDFSFRFESGYVVRCPMRQFGGKEDTLANFVRITPAGAPPRLLGISHDVPGVPAGMAANTAKKLNADARFSGGFSLGKGRYTIGLLIRDDRGRFFAKTWKLNAAPTRSERGTPLELPPGEVTPVGAGPWEPLRPTPYGLKLTVLLDAAPTRGNSPELHPWDRVLLLQSLSSLLEQTPSRSVRLIAFNLDQERKIYEQDPFDESGFARLFRALTHLTLGTISYRAIEQGAGQHLLLNLVNQEADGTSRPDAVVILGPRTSLEGRIPREMQQVPEGHGVRLFYFQYFSNMRDRGEASDPIAVLTRARGGTVFIIGSPGGLAEAIGKFNELVKHGGA